MPSNLIEYGQAVAAFHMQVGEHKVVVCVAHQTDGLVAARRRVDDVAFILKNRGRSDPQALFVVNNQQPGSLGKRIVRARIIKRRAVSRMVECLTHLIANLDSFCWSSRIGDSTCSTMLNTVPR